MSLFHCLFCLKNKFFLKMTRKTSWNINALIFFNLLQEHPRQSFAGFDEAHMNANKCVDSLCVF